MTVVFTNRSESCFLDLPTSALLLIASANKNWWSEKIVIKINNRLTKICVSSRHSWGYQWYASYVGTRIWKISPKNLFFVL